MIEKERHRKAFEQYYAMGRTRSLTKLAKRIGASVQALKVWSREFDWQGRIAQRDRDIARVVKSETIKAEIDSQIRNKQIVQMALVTIARQIAEGRVKCTLGDLDKLIRLEAFLEGRADSRQEVIARDLQGKSTAELRVMLRKEVASLQDLVGEDEAIEIPEIDQQ